MNQQSMSMDRVVVLKTIFRADVDSLSLSLVEYDDGQLGILRNGAAISPRPWPTTELVDCVETFQRLAHELAGNDGDA